MKKQLIKCSKIMVDCVHNDPVDIKAGGPTYLGFDFYVNAEDVRKMIAFIASTLNKFQIPLTNISIEQKTDLLNLDEVWTEDRIFESIEKDVDYLIHEASRGYGNKGQAQYSDENVTFKNRTLPNALALIQYAKDYIKSERKLTANVSSKVRDAIIADAINYFIFLDDSNFYVDANDLHNEHSYSTNVETNALLKTFASTISECIFDDAIADSGLIYMNLGQCKEITDIDDIALVLIDYINYISEKACLNRNYTLAELQEIEHDKKHKEELDKLKSFLIKSGEYYERMQNGQDLDSIYRNISIAHGLDSISSTGVYYYTEEAALENGTSEMYIWDKAAVEREIYAIAYAYAKMHGIKEEPRMPIIKTKIKEMLQTD